MKGVFTSWWFGEAVIFALCGVVIAAAAILTPTEAAVAFFGFEIPVSCGWRRATGTDCMGCGMTRSFTFMAHGQLGEAFSLHRAGPFVFALVASQPPYRAFTLARGWWRRRASRG